MTRLQAAASNFRQHWCKQKGICFADEGDAHRAVAQELMLEAFGGLHTRKSSADDHDALHLLRHASRALRFRSEDLVGEILESLREQTEQRPIENPAHKSWKVRAHLLRTPIRSAVGDQRYRNDADQSPERHAQCRGG